MCPSLLDLQPSGLVRREQEVALERVEGAPAIREATRVLAGNDGAPRHPLVFVTGKGGVGKTTVAAALALAGVAEHRSVILCGAARGELPPLACESVAIDPERALGEWLGRHLGAPAAALLRRAPMFGYFVAAAPGAAELVTIGKVVDLARERGRDSVVVDGPATGHALAMLAAPRTFADLAPTGPVAREAAAVGRLLSDPAFTAYVGVTTSEELAIAELLELDASLPAVVGRGLDLVVVNAVRPDGFSDEDAERMQATAGRGPSRALLEALLVEHRRARREAARVRKLRRRVSAPLVSVPLV